MEILASALLLFLVMDPLGNIPLFLAVLRNVPEEHRQRVLWRELLIAYALLLLFMFGGNAWLAWLNLSEEAIALSGAIILFLIALRMIFGHESGIFGENTGREPLVVPLATPAVAGPSALAIIMLMSRNQPDALSELLLATTLAWLATALILAAAPLLFRALKDRGLEAVQRLMGMILIMISVQMMLDALRKSLS